MDRADFGARIRVLRSAARLTQGQLGGMLNVTGQAVAHWESGRSLPQAVEVPTLANALGTTICGLYGVNEGHTGQQDREKRVREVRDAAVARLIAGHEQAPKAEQDFIREIAEAADRFRQRLVNEEGLDGPVPATPAALTD